MRKKHHFANLEHRSFSYPGLVIPDQTCLCCCSEKSVFYLGFISFEPLSKLSFPAPTCPGMAGAPLFPWLILGVVALPALLPLAARTLLDLREQRRLTPLSQECPTLLLICFFIWDSEHFSVFLLCRKGQRLFTLLSSVEACVCSNHFPSTPRKAAARPAMSQGHRWARTCLFVSPYLRIFFH